MQSLFLPTIPSAIHASIELLKKYGEEVDTGHWQGVPTEGKPDLVTKEILDLSWRAPMPDTLLGAQLTCEPNLPWAENHFQERVSRIPSNPGEEYKNWPWWHGQVDQTQEQEQFTHTYQERFWPKQAGSPYPGEDYHLGIRYPYGDLDSVVDLLQRHPYTRQAYFPIFFPEDTGAVHGGRVPCTLGYHFLLRGGALHCWYAIRSCDAVRHFRDDIYLATRLVQWILKELVAGENHWDDVKPGNLYFTAYSFHAHKGDLHLL